MKAAQTLFCALACALAIACGRDVPGRYAARAEAAQAITPQARGAESDRVRVLDPAEEIYDVAPDGKLAAYIDWNTGNLMVRDLASGALRNLTNKGTYKTSGDEAESALFSPDGKEIAYEWYTAKPAHDELRVVNLADGSIRTLLKAPPGYGIWPDSWSFDGRQILNVFDAPDHAREFQLISVAGGSVRTLKKFSPEFRMPSYTRFSPDGKYLLYRAAGAFSQVPRAQLIDLASGRETTLLEDSSALFYPIAWQSGSRLLFASERSGTPGIWSVAVQNGRVHGAPQLLRADLWHLTDWLTRLTTDGRLFYEIRAGDRDVYTAAFDANTGQLLSQPVSLTHRPGENYINPTWSPDGQSIAYIVFSAPTVPSKLAIKAADGQSDGREYVLPMNRPSPATWIPGQQAVMINGVDSRGHWTQFRFDLETNRGTPVVRDAFSATTFSRDGKEMYYAPSLKPWPDSLERSRMLVRDLTTGRDRVLLNAPATMRVAPVLMTPDHKQVILVVVPTGNRFGQKRVKGIWAFSIADGTTHNLIGSIPLDSANEYVRPMGFTPDQQSLLVHKAKVEHPDSFTLWRVSLDNGTAVRLPNAPPELRDPNGPTFSISPDGRRIAFTVGTLSTELWVLKDPRLAQR